MASLPFRINRLADNLMLIETGYLKGLARLKLCFQVAFLLGFIANSFNFRYGVGSSCVDCDWIGDILTCPNQS